MSDLALEPVKVAVIGAGLIGRRHIKHVHKESSTSLAAIVEPSAAGIKLAREYDVPHFESLGKLLESTTVVDAVILGTPTHTHVSLALLCLQNDKHVLVEKPVASSVEEGNTLLSAVQSSKARVIVSRAFCLISTGKLPVIDVPKTRRLGITGGSIRMSFA
jgi:predicted dehydrogenase